MSKQNEKLLNNIKKLERSKLPKWFSGELYEEGAEKGRRPRPSRHPQRPDQRGSRCRVDVTGRAVVALPL